MQRKRELKIDTEFFEDHLGLDIPQAILIAPNTEVFIKEGLNEDFNDEDNNQDYDPADAINFAAQTVERVMSSKLVDNFLFCWELLKRHPFVVDSGRISQHSQSGHRRQSPIVQNIVTEDDRVVSESVDERALRRQKIGLDRGDISIGKGSNVEWLEQKREFILGGRRREVDVRRDLEKGKDSQLQRAKVLKQIVDKLKQSRGQMKSLLEGVEHIRETHHLNHKLNKLERLIQDLHNDRQNYQQPPPQTSKFQPQQQVIVTDFNANNVQEDEMMSRLAGELSHLRQEMELLRRQNEKILREEESKKIELVRIAQTKEEIKKTYEIVSRQIQQLQTDKSNNISAQQSWLENKRKDQQIQIVRLQERVKYLQLIEQRQQIMRQQIQRQQITRSQIGRTMIPVGGREPVFPFGPAQSGWASSGVRVQPVSNNWIQPPALIQTQITREAPLHQTTILKSNDPNNEFRELPTASPPSNLSSRAILPIYSAQPLPYTPQPLEQSIRVPSDWQSRMQQQGGWGCC